VAWLIRDGDVLATLEVAGSTIDRLKGVAGRDRLEGALLLRSPVLLQTCARRSGIDVAYCDRELRVRRTRYLRPWRVALPRPAARHLLVAPEGAFERWRLSVGDLLEIKGA
jgi:uncharacterized membrane protein (UPF0127 family)